MSIRSFALFGILVSTFAQAALPPYYNRARVFNAIVQDQRVETAVTDSRFRDKASGVIDAIRYLGEQNGYSRYDVQTGRCLLDINARVVAEGGGVVGPGKLELAVARSLRCQ